MSARAFAYVKANSRHRGPTFVVHLMLADTANEEHDNRYWKTLDQLAADARVSKTSAQRALRDLVAAGDIQIAERPLRQPTIYRLVIPPLCVDPETFAIHTNGGGLSDHPTRSGDGLSDYPGWSVGLPQGGLTDHQNSIENSIELKTPPPTPSATRCARTSDGFAEFWSQYPVRKRSGSGTKGSKKVAHEQWSKLSVADREIAFGLLPLYARAAGSYPKDAERYLRDRAWEGLEERPCGSGLLENMERLAARAERIYGNGRA